MRKQRAVLALALAAVLTAACDEAPPGSAGNDTAILGGGGERPPGPPPLADGQGREIPQPPLPANTAARIVPAGGDAALALWVHEGTITAAAYEPGAGWGAPQALEDIHGEASEPELAGNGQGKGLAVWRHTVGSIESLRFSRFTPGAGWSIPDVMPGALPRPRGAGGSLELSMDGTGNATARWSSGFDAREVQVARYTDGEGWSRATSEPLAAAR